MNKDLAIVYITDESFIDYTLTSIKSLLLCATKPVHIYVICNNVSNYGQRRLDIDPCIELIAYKGDVSGYGSYRHVTPSTFIKFDIPKILENEKICLYIDGDTIVVKDVTSIFKYDVTNYLAGVMEDFGRHFIWKDSKEGDKFYAGTMLLNLEQMRKENIAEKLHTEKSKHPDINVWNEQDIFNLVLAGRVLHLPITYCISIEKIKYGKNNEYRNIALYNSLYGTKYKSIEDLVSDATIFHFHGDKSKVYAHSDFYDLIDRVEDEFLQHRGAKTYIFSNVCRFKDTEDFKCEINKLGIESQDRLVFLNTAPWLTKFLDCFPNAKIITLHRFKRDSSGWWGLEDILSLKDKSKIQIEALLLDNRGNISTIDCHPLAKVILNNYPFGRMPTTGFFAYWYARQTGCEDIRLVNFYGLSDKSTPHFQGHEWIFEQKVLSKVVHIFLEPNGKTIVKGLKENRIGVDIISKKNGYRLGGSTSKFPLPKVYYGKQSRNFINLRAEERNW